MEKMETFLALFVAISLIYGIVMGIIGFFKSGTRYYKRSRNGFIAFLVSFICFGIFFANGEDQTVVESASARVEESREETLVQEVPIQEEVIQDETSAQEEVEATSSANIIQLLDRNEAKQIVKENAEETWGTDFSMIEFEVDLNMEAFDWLYALDINNEVEEGILESAYQTWGYNFSMIKFEYEMQLESFHNLYGE